MAHIENHTTGIILAAGLGTRMRSNKAKVLHEILGRPMILYVVQEALSVLGHVIVVVGHQAEQVRCVLGTNPRIRFAMQAEQRGTGHATQCAMSLLPEQSDTVVILCGDTPLIRSRTLEQLVSRHLEMKNHLTLLSMELDAPSGYGRVIVNEAGQLSGIVEEADATAEQKKIRLVNSGVYCVERNWLQKALGQLKPINAQGEYYLTDILAMGYEEAKRMGAVIATDSGELQGVNTTQQLAIAEDRMRSRQGKMA